MLEIDGSYGEGGGRILRTASRITRRLLTSLGVITLFQPLSYSVQGEEGRAGRVTMSGTGPDVDPSGRL